MLTSQGSWPALPSVVAYGRQQRQLSYSYDNWDRSPFATCVDGLVEKGYCISFLPMPHNSNELCGQLFHALPSVGNYGGKYSSFTLIKSVSTLPLALGTESGSGKGLLSSAHTTICQIRG